MRWFCFPPTLVLNLSHGGSFPPPLAGRGVAYHPPEHAASPFRLYARWALPALSTFMPAGSCPLCQHFTQGSRHTDDSRGGEPRDCRIHSPPAARAHTSHSPQGHMTPTLSHRPLCRGEMKRLANDRGYMFKGLHLRASRGIRLDASWCKFARASPT